MPLCPSGCCVCPCLGMVDGGGKGSGNMTTRVLGGMYIYMGGPDSQGVGGCLRV